MKVRTFGRFEGLFMFEALSSLRSFEPHPFLHMRISDKCMRYVRPPFASVIFRYGNVDKQCEGKWQQIKCLEAL